MLSRLVINFLIINKYICTHGRAYRRFNDGLTGSAKHGGTANWLLPDGGPAGALQSTHHLGLRSAHSNDLVCMN